MRNQLILNAFQAFEEISNTTSRLEKKAVVEREIRNPVFNDLVLRTYDPFRMYYVKKLPKLISLETEETEESTLDVNFFRFTTLLTSLSTRFLSGNAALAEIQRVFNQMNEQEQKWYSRVLQKDLKIGMTSNTFNQVHWGLQTGFSIPTFSCALAHTYNKKKLPVRFVIEPKLDGYRCLAFRYPTHVELRSRNGKPIEGYTRIEKAIESFEVGYVYDGEIMSESGTFADMQKYAGRKDMDDKPGIFNIFDVVPIKEFLSGTGEDLFFQRRIQLETFFKEGNGEESPVLELVPMTISGATQVLGMASAEALAKAEELVMHTHRELVEKGYEGSMVKDADGRYECKRSWNIQKVKDMDTVDLVVIDVEKGKEGTQFENTLGSLVVNYKGYPVNVGSGFTPEERDRIWKNKTDIINRTVEVKYFEESKNKDDELSLRFPIFVQIRYDKD